MKRLRNFFIIVADHDAKIFNIFGPMDDDTTIINEVVRMKSLGKNINCFNPGEHFNGKEEIIKSYSTSSGYKYSDSSLFRRRVESPAYYDGDLPQYAQKADRNRVVKILCKGNCGQVRWAEMKVNFPGPDILRSSDLRDFEAQCLKCGKIAFDCYNWYR